ncbi:hypothetical protein [Streptomyces sp. NPDC046821]|uniref:hypothetical protein n=1 Tax=Streptomyces sp. NPDC046821 TaxID=3154702 RepID=UPI0033FDCE08
MATSNPNSPPHQRRSSRDRLLVAAGVLAVVSAALLAAHVSFDGDAFRNCAYLGPSTRMYLTAWAAPVCAAASLVLACLRPRRTPRFTASRTALVCVVALLLFAQLFALYGVYAPDPAGGADCSGLAAITR